MRTVLSGVGLAFVLVAASTLSAQDTFPEGSNRMGAPGFAPGFQVEPATGALTWALPIGVVPGDLPVPVVFRYQASMAGELITSTMNPSGAPPTGPVLRYRGIWASLHFGFIAPARDLGQGLSEEGTQSLEDGTVLHDRDWQAWVADGEGLPVAFGFKAPPLGYARDSAGTHGLFTATLEDLGTWRDRVADLTGATRFQVLMDQSRARV